jgi:nicotinate-nucleotide pyrophosphorylase (carboxylating)
MAYTKYFLITNKPKLNKKTLTVLIVNSLNEDLASRDVTTKALIPKLKKIKAVVIVKEKCLVCGLEVAKTVFKTFDKKVNFIPLVKEGKKIRPNTIIAKIEGNARSILSAERVALNFLSLLSAIATRTNQYVEKIKPYKVKIVDTRKTLPGLRELEKYAVRIGGGFNHRFSLAEMVLIKDNHLKIIKGKLKKIKLPEGVKTEIEVKNIKEFKAALKLKPQVIMLDNMDFDNIKRAVRQRNSLAKKSLPLLEASGRVNLKNIKKIASSGIDIISVGNLTHSLEAIDLSLEVL